MKDIKILKKATGDTTDNIHNHSPVAVWRNSHVLYITIIMLTLSVIVTLSTFSFSAPAKADSSIEITAGSTEHTIVIPFEKSFLFVANIKNNGSTTEIVSLTSGNNIPRDWHLLVATGQYHLAPGQSVDYVAVFEPSVTPQSGEEIVKVPISFSWDGGSKTFDLTVKTKILSLSDLQDENAKVAVSILDESNNSPISGASVVATLPSGIESYEARPSKDGYELSLPSGGYLRELANDYQIDHTSIGYYLQVYAEGYKGYFESNYLPGADDSKTIKLEPLSRVAEYNEHKTVVSGYSIWWIRASDDGGFLAFSQAAHGQPGQEPPDQTKVLLTDDNGEVIWEKQIGGECWGLDISPDGQYVAAGCHDGNTYLWDRSGREIWKRSSVEEGTDQSSSVRWVKFSPDGNYLLSGPTAMNSGTAGLFEVQSGNLLWSFDTGDWLREARFSSDGKTAYLSSSNGAIQAVDVSSGELKWLGAGDHVVPFLLAVNEQLGWLVSSGKGRAFTAIDLTDGSHRWRTVVDQTVTAAQMADDGSIVGATVGGMAYGVSPDGSLKWMRRYGGVGHNGVHYTSNGQYAVLGGPNPTLFSSDGSVLWQRERDKRIEMTGPAEQDTGGANAVWISEDASLIVLGGDDGKITFYKGGVKTGDNGYSQLSGLDLASYDEEPVPSPPVYDEEPVSPPPAYDEEPVPPQPSTAASATPAAVPEPINWPLIGGIIGGVVVIGLGIFLVRRRAH